MDLEQEFALGDQQMEAINEAMRNRLGQGETSMFGYEDDPMLDNLLDPEVDELQERVMMAGSDSQTLPDDEAIALNRAQTRNAAQVQVNRFKPARGRVDTQRSRPMTTTTTQQPQHPAPAPKQHAPQQQYQQPQQSQQRSRPIQQKPQLNMKQQMEKQQREVERLVKRMRFRPVEELRNETVQRTLAQVHQQIMAAKERALAAAVAVASSQSTSTASSSSSSTTREDDAVSIDSDASWFDSDDSSLSSDSEEEEDDGESAETATDNQTAAAMVVEPAKLESPTNNKMPLNSIRVKQRVRISVDDDERSSQSSQTPPETNKRKREQEEPEDGEIRLASDDGFTAPGPHVKASRVGGSATQDFSSAKAPAETKAASSSSTEAAASSEDPPTRKKSKMMSLSGLKKVSQHSRRAKDKRSVAKVIKEGTDRKRWADKIREVAESSGNAEDMLKAADMRIDACLEFMEACQLRAESLSKIHDKVKFEQKRTECVRYCSKTAELLHDTQRRFLDAEVCGVDHPRREALVYRCIAVLHYFSVHVLWVNAYKRALNTMDAAIRTKGEDSWQLEDHPKLRKEVNFVHKCNVRMAQSMSNWRKAKSLFLMDDNALMVEDADDDSQFDVAAKFPLRRIGLFPELYSVKSLTESVTYVRRAVQLIRQIEEAQER